MHYTHTCKIHAHMHAHMHRTSTVATEMPRTMMQEGHGIPQGDAGEKILITDAGAGVRPNCFDVLDKMPYADTQGWPRP